METDRAKYRGGITRANTEITDMTRRQSVAALQEMKRSYRYFVLKGKARVAENTSKFLLDQRREEFTEEV